jgi:GNAT superfamily N-acetyltransferase
MNDKPTAFQCLRSINERSALLLLILLLCTDLVAGGVGLIEQRLPSPTNPTGRYGYVLSMVTEPAWRGRGIATGIMEALLAWFGDEAVTRVSLHATTAGEPIYRSLGFSASTYPELRWIPEAPAS